MDMKMTSKPLALQRAERGFALVITLLLLVALSLVGVTALRNVSLQEKMAGNFFFRSSIGQEAEAVARYARQRVDKASVDSNARFPEVFIQTTPTIGNWTGLAKDSSLAFWSNPANWTAGAATTNLSTTRPADTKSSIEQLAGTHIFYQDSSPIPVNFFRMTGRATETATGSASVVQEWSMYAAD
jgi:Tfp pilus assembly protein PilX